MHRWLACGVLAVSALLFGVSAGASARWHLAQSGHFTVVGDGGEDEVRLVARELEQLRSIFESVLKQRVASARPFVVIAARGEKSMRRLVPSFWERRGGMHPGGLFIAGEVKNWAIVRGDLENPTRAIYHEYAHLLTELSLGPLPLWLDEGLADFFGATEVRDDTVMIGAIEPGHLAQLQGHLPVPIVQLVTADYGSAEYTQDNSTSGFYAESAVLTHFLLFGDDGTHRPQLVTYLQLLEQGIGDREALDRAFGGAAPLEKKLLAYARRQLFPAFTSSVTVPDDSIRVRELRPAEAATLLADFMVRTGQLREARAQVEEALRAEPTLGSAHLQLGLLLVAEGRRYRASLALAEARRLAPDDGLIQYHFGAFARPPVADVAVREDALRTAIRLGGASGPARNAMARLLLEEERSPDEALGLATIAVRLDPGSVTYRVTLLELEHRMGCPADAERDEQRLLRVVSRDPTALAALVEFHESNGRPEEAEAILRRVRDQSPRNVFATQVLESFLTRQGRPDEGEAVLREGLRLEPQSDHLLNSLAYLNADRGVKLEEALALAEKALKIAPDQAAIQDTKAWALFRLGRLREAEEWTRKSLDATESVEVRDHLGDILEKQGRLGEAVGEWRRALANDNATDTQRESLKAKIARVEADLGPRS